MTTAASTQTSRDTEIFAAAAQGTVLGLTGKAMTVAEFAEDTYGATVAAHNLPTFLHDDSNGFRVALSTVAAADQDRMTRTYAEAVEGARNEAVLFSALTAIFGDTVPYDALRQAANDAFWMQQQVVAHEKSSEAGEDLYAAIDDRIESARRAGEQPTIHRLQIWDAPAFAEQQGVHLDSDEEWDGTRSYGYSEDLDALYAETYGQRVYAVGTALWAISATNRAAAVGGSVRAAG